MMCVLCNANSGNTKEAIVFEDADVVAAITLHQKSNNHGAVMVYPRRHYETIIDTPLALLQQLIRVVQACAKAATSALGCSGVTIVQNNGKAAGQDVFHVHFHVIPRHRDDGFQNTKAISMGIDGRRLLAEKIRTRMSPAPLEIPDFSVELSNEPVDPDLLLLADPSPEAVAGYNDSGTAFVAKSGGQIVGALILVPSGDDLEIVNIAVREFHRKQGIGTGLINAAIAHAKKCGSGAIEIGTGNSSLSQLSLYQKCGFRISRVRKDYFAGRYNEPVFENGLECRDMIVLRMELRANGQGGRRG